MLTPALRRFPTLLALFFFAAHALAEDGVQVAQAIDLQTDGTLSAEQTSPILLMVSRTNCGYCVRIKREVIEPMIRSGQYTSNTLIRELLIDPDETVVDFTGHRIASVELAQRYQAALTPTLLFLDAQGRELSHRMVGVSGLDYYAYFVDQSLDEARAKLRKD